MNVDCTTDRDLVKRFTSPATKLVCMYFLYSLGGIQDFTENIVEKKNGKMQIYIRLRWSVHRTALYQALLLTYRKG